LVSTPRSGSGRSRAPAPASAHVQRPSGQDQAQGSEPARTRHLAPLSRRDRSRSAPRWRLAKIALRSPLIAPLAFFMGMPFPLALARLRASAPDLVPWAWAINGRASVLAAILATLLAMTFGTRIVVFAAAALYLVAGLALPRTARPFLLTPPTAPFSARRGISPRRSSRASHSLPSRAAGRWFDRRGSPNLSTSAANRLSNKRLVSRAFPRSLLPMPRSSPCDRPLG
jgi:hypothetical protein